MYLLPILIIILIIIIYLINNNTFASFQQTSSRCLLDFSESSHNEYECNINRFGKCLKNSNDTYGKCISENQRKLIDINSEECETNWEDRPYTQDEIRAADNEVIDRDKMCPHTNPICNNGECVNQERLDNLNSCFFSYADQVSTLEDKQQKCTKNRPICHQNVASEPGVCITTEQKSNLDNCSQDSDCNLNGLISGYMCERNKCIDINHINDLNTNGCSQDYDSSNTNYVSGECTINRPRCIKTNPDDPESRGSCATERQIDSIATTGCNRNSDNNLDDNYNKFKCTADKPTCLGYINSDDMGECYNQSEIYNKSENCNSNWSRNRQSIPDICSKNKPICSYNSCMNVQELTSWRNWVNKNFLDNKTYYIKVVGLDKYLSISNNIDKNDTNGQFKLLSIHNSPQKKGVEECKFRFRHSLKFSNHNNLMSFTYKIYNKSESLEYFITNPKSSLTLRMNEHRKLNLTTNNNRMGKFKLINIPNTNRYYIKSSYWTSGDTYLKHTSISRCYPNDGKPLPHGKTFAPYSKCNSGYRPIVQSKNIKWWACGSECKGGNYLTDTACRCACIPEADCNDIIESSNLSSATQFELIEI